MEDFDRLVELADSEEVVAGVAIPKAHMHKWLMLGQSDYLCEYGTLGEGHEKFTPAQRYAQALKELYVISLNIQQTKAAAMRAQAKLLDGEDAMRIAKTEADKLRAGATILEAQTSLLSSATSVEDQTRMVKFYHRKVKELAPAVEAAYPLGIESAEQANWETVASYRLEKEKTQGLARERMDHLPLPADRKAILGYAAGRPDAIAGLLVTDPQRCQDMGEAVQRLIESKRITQKETN